MGAIVLIDVSFYPRHGAFGMHGMGMTGLMGFGGMLFLIFILWIFLAMLGSRSAGRGSVVNLVDENARLKGQVAAYEKMLGIKERVVAEPPKDSLQKVGVTESKPGQPSIARPPVSNQKTLYCLGCGRQLPSVARFCPDCGKKARPE